MRDSCSPAAPSSSDSSRRRAQPQVVSPRPDPSLGYLVDVFDSCARTGARRGLSRGRGDDHRHAPSGDPCARSCAAPSGVSRRGPREVRVGPPGRGRAADRTRCVVDDGAQPSRATRREVRLFEINERIAYDLAGLARPITASAKSSAPIDYCVADARQMPFADASLDLVVSAFFTDVVPLSALLREVRRVLAPEGPSSIRPLGITSTCPRRCGPSRRRDRCSRGMGSSCRMKRGAGVAAAIERADVEHPGRRMELRRGRAVVRRRTGHAG